MIEDAVQRTKNRTKPIRQLLKKFLHDWSLDLASMLAYNFLVAILPIAIIVFGLIGLILRNSPEHQDDLKNKIIQSFPTDNTTQNGIKQIVDLAFNQLSNDAGLIFVIGILLAMFGSSRLFIEIDQSMTIIYRLPERSFLRQNLMALGTLFLLIIVIVLMLTASSVPTAVMNNVSSGGAQFGVFLAGIALSSSIAFGLFEIIYWLVPNKKMSFKTTWRGALTAAVTIEIFIILFPLYVRQFMSNYAGQIGFAVILILFFYYFAIILIIGAQINAYYVEHYKPLPDPLGTYLSKLYGEHTEQDRHGCFCRKRQEVEPQSLEEPRV
ncbi:unnamed protein product [Adineta ricciae]|uniref:YihY/virulence factor BrkB family protein n=1 Tax=Adineta ricciae TaxID=249248 RepID=A0A814FSZ1_ADIRI|nr:unnamed protein product [Adineta ricciae]CAF1021163.1 unnamed protein product [Adineta ricciae]